MDRCRGGGAVARGPARLLPRGRSGATALEFGMLAPVLLLMLGGVVELGHAFWTRSAMQYAVEQAARCAAVDQTRCGNAGQIRAYASRPVFGKRIPPQAFSVTTAACGRQVSAELEYELFTRHLVPYTVTLTAMSCHPA